ncbi:hypothetical protein M1523_00905 [Patescibacteria group bacterium]|nr:hypothetical protein [Patescibacteria group bacterium]MCL5091716.1 hypothetical protein [Patescibacteria group bacterium]
MKYKINLFPAKERTLMDKVVYFSLNYLRYILVITQTVIIGVFFYRIKIDQEIVDLKDSLSQKQEIVSVSTPLMSEAEAVDRTTRLAADIVNDQNKTQQMLSYFLSRFPEKMTMTRLVINNDSVEFEAMTVDSMTIKLFTNRIAKEAHFGAIQLKKIQKREGGFFINFVLNQYH